MATRQYIGARYVPVFYTNSDGTAEWRGGVIYEPLTIVTWQGDSYTSRQYVPARINLDDAEYWARTGNFNGQIETYRAEVARYAAEVEGMLDEAKAYTDSKADDLEFSKVPFPVTDRLGTLGQVLSSNADGSTTWADPVIPDAEATAAAVDAWLDDHPEATTTVQDDSITNAKIRNNAIQDAKLAPYGVRNRVDNVVATIGSIYAENASYGSDMVYVPGTSNRLLTGFFKPQTAPFTVDANTGYQFRAFTHQLGLQPITVTGWSTTLTFSQVDRYIQFVVRKSNDADITPDEIEDAFATDLSGIPCMIPSMGLWNLAKDTADTVADVQSSVTGITSNVNAITKRIEGITNASGVYVEQASIASDGTYSHGVPTRILTGLMRFKTTPVTLTLAEGYSIRTASYDMSLNLVTIAGWTTSAVTVTRTDRYIRLLVRIPGDLPITPDMFDEAVTISTDDFVCLIPSVSLLNEIGDTNTSIDDTNTALDAYKAEVALQAQYGMNVNQVGNYDEVWEFGNWMYPSIQSLDKLRDRLFFTFGTHSGRAGIAQYDFDTKELTKTLLKENTAGEVDDHDIMGMRILSTGHIVCIYSGAHNLDKRMYVRYGLTPESIDVFSEVTAIDSAYLTTYCQLFEYAGHLWMFYRGSNTRWLYRYSDGITRDGIMRWSQEQVLISYSAQMYCTLKETTEPGTLRICCYTNPSQDDTAIRMCFFHLGNKTLYDVDNTTPIGLSATLTNITSLIPVPENNMVNRLFEAAITAPSDNKILFCRFTNEPNTSDGTYYVYDNGTILPVASCGTAIWIPKGQSGIVWCGTDKIVLGRGDSGNDKIEIYDYDVSTGATLSKVVASNARQQRGTNWYRTARPIVDDNQRVIAFWEGYYSPSTFNNSYPSARIYDIANDEMLV